jgi:hypothetical protein
MWAYSEDFSAPAGEDFRAITDRAHHRAHKRGTRDMQNVGFGIFVGALSLVGMAILVFAISGPMAVS